MTTSPPEPQAAHAHEHASAHGSDYSHGDGDGDGAEAGAAGARVTAIPGEAPQAFWERKYSATGPVWSGRVNATLASVVEKLEPGHSLDLGSGEGGDVLWLAEQGWDASGIELSQTAIDRARAEAKARGLKRTRFVAADLGDWIMRPAVIDVRFQPYDLVTASFLQSPVELPRELILRTAASRVAPGGMLVVISHAAPPAWAKDHPGDFPSPEEELATLALDPDRWEVVTAEVRTRKAVTPDGAETELADTLVVAQRIA